TSASRRLTTLRTEPALSRQAATAHCACGIRQPENCSLRQRVRTGALFLPWHSVWMATASQAVATMAWSGFGPLPGSPLKALCFRETTALFGVWLSLPTESTLLRAVPAGKCADGI